MDVQVAENALYPHMVVLIRNRFRESIMMLLFQKVLFLLWQLKTHSLKNDQTRVVCRIARKKCCCGKFYFYENIVL